MIKDKSCLFKDIIEDMKNIYLEFGDEKLIEDDDGVYTLSKKSLSQILNAMSLIILIMTTKQEKKFFLNMLLSIR